MNPYLAASKYIDFDHPIVSAKAAELADGVSWQERTAPIQAALAEFQYFRVNSAGAK